MIAKGTAKNSPGVEKRSEGVVWSGIEWKNQEGE